MPTMFDDVNAQCPFYIGSSKQKIMCEGVTDGCITNLEFKTKDKRNRHRRQFCDSKYKDCRIYRVLEEKYEK